MTLDIVNMMISFSGSRFPGSLNMDMNEVATNLVPYPKLHYIFSSTCPVTLAAPNMCNMQETKYVNFFPVALILKHKCEIREV